MTGWLVTWWCGNCKNKTDPRQLQTKPADLHENEPVTNLHGKLSLFYKPNWKQTRLQKATLHTPDIRYTVIRLCNSCLCAVSASIVCLQRCHLVPNYCSLCWLFYGARPSACLRVAVCMPEWLWVFVCVYDCSCFCKICAMHRWIFTTVFILRQKHELITFRALPSMLKYIFWIFSKWYFQSTLKNLSNYNRRFCNCCFLFHNCCLPPDVTVMNNLSQMYVRINKVI